MLSVDKINELEEENQKLKLEIERLNLEIYEWKKEYENAIRDRVNEQFRKEHKCS